MRRRELTVWLAFADLMFLLFVTVLAAGAAAWTRSEEEEARNTSLMARQVRIKAEIARLRQEEQIRCSAVDPLLTQLSACLASSLGAVDIVDRELCAVSVSERLLQFQEGEDTPTDEGRARALTNCLYRSMADFRSSHGTAFDTIRTVHIDGHTDCKGADEANMELGVRRAMRLYTTLLSTRPAADEDRKAIFTRIAVRSFGEAVPTKESRCYEGDGYADDRRVRISIETKLSLARR